VTSDRQVDDAVYLLQEAAKTSIPELNPDGIDQAAHTMRYAIVDALEVLGGEIPEQRTSMANDPAMEHVCICGRTKT
jgi:hypothetical protein